MFTTDTISKPRSVDTRQITVPTPAMLRRPAPRPVRAQPVPVMEAYVAVVPRAGVVGWSLCWDDEDPVGGSIVGRVEDALAPIAALIAARATSAVALVYTAHAGLAADLAWVPGVVVAPRARSHPRRGDANERARVEADAVLRAAEPVVVAVDASFGRGTRAAAWAFLAEDGRHQSVSTAKARSILQAEVLAIRLALKVIPAPVRMVVLSDSRRAIQAVTSTGPVDAAIAELVDEVRMLLAEREVEVRWTKGHVGPGLHDGADRLAVAARRARECNVPAATAREIAARIVEESTAAHREPADVALAV